MGAACSHDDICTGSEQSEREKRNMDPADKFKKPSRRRNVQDHLVPINPNEINHSNRSSINSNRSTFDLDDGVADILTKIQISTPTMPDSDMFSPLHMTDPIQVASPTPGPNGPITSPISGPIPGPPQLLKQHSNTITKDRAKGWDTNQLLNLESEMQQEMQAMVRSQSMSGLQRLVAAQPPVSPPLSPMRGSMHGSYSASANFGPIVPGAAPGTHGVAFYPDRHHVIMETVEMDTGPAVLPTQSVYSKDAMSTGVLSDDDMDDRELQEMRQQIRRLSELSAHRTALL